MTYPNTGGHDPDVPAGGEDTDGVMLSPLDHPADGPGVNYGVPAEYVGPDVSEQVPLINPSAGTQGPTEQGMANVNPQGPAPHPGSAGPASSRQVFPDTTQDVYPR